MSANIVPAYVDPCCYRTDAREPNAYECSISQDQSAGIVLRGKAQKTKIALISSSVVLLQLSVLETKNKLFIREVLL